MQQNPLLGREERVSPCLKRRRRKSTTLSVPRSHQTCRPSPTKGEYLFRPPSVGMPGTTTFALAVSGIRQTFPEDFVRAEIVDSGHAWVSFAGSVPEGARDMIDIFSAATVSIYLRLGHYLW